MKLMDGKRSADFFQKKTQQKVQKLKQELKVQPCLSVVLIGENPASQVYVRRKAKACRQIGLQSQILNLPQDISLQKVQKTISSLNQDPLVHGILVQLPLPKHLNPHQVLSFISPKKDVDGLTAENMGKLWLSQPGIKPCTPQGIICLLEYYKVPLEGKRAAVVGRSSIVGRPMAQLLLEQQATVTLCHSKTKNLEEHTQQADIVIAACGRHHLLKVQHFKKGAAVVDVGIHRIQKTDKSVLEGDVCPDSLESRVEYFSPVPGGVGPMTIAMLLENTYHLASAQTAP